jgi:SNF2 family DNA or RNA helicase
MTTLLDDTEAVIDRIKSLPDIKFPKLKYWNYDACEYHAEVGPQPDCKWQLCGGDLFSHQRVTATWLLARKKGIVASVPGSGKTNSLLAAICVLKERNLLPNRAIIIPETAAVGQWSCEVSRWAPGLKVIAVDGSIPKKKRIAMYASQWDVAIIGSHCANSDVKNLEKLEPTLLATDDVDPLLNHDTVTHRAINKLSKKTTYSVTMNATVIQMRLEQAHAALTPADGYRLFGDLTSFTNRHIQTTWIPEYDDHGRATRSVKTTGYRRLDEFGKKFHTVYFRHTLDDLDIDMPELMPPTVEWVDLSPSQRERYEELQAGVMTLLREEGPKIKQVTAFSKFTYGQMICAGLPALGEPDGKGASPKLDRFFRLKTTAWEDEKVIVFMKNIGMIKAAAARAQHLGIKYSVVIGKQHMSKEQRDDQIKKFRVEDDCQLLFGTTTIERSLNLQSARIVAAIDLQLNPARVQQLIGRAQRAGSSHDKMFMFNFLTNNTIEEKYLAVLARRQGLHNAVTGDEIEIFGALSPMELLMLFRKD